MNNEGLDYNTKREKLALPEYGREIQQMVDYCVALEDRAERQHCAESIIVIMDRMFPENRGVENHEQKLWDQLAIMSGFQLDIDYPFPICDAVKIAEKPGHVGYPMKRIPVRHYGAMLFQIFDKLKTMEPGKERDDLVKLTAHQMHRNLMQWSHGSCDGQKVAADLERFTDGNIQVDPSSFNFDSVKEAPARSNGGNNGKKKK